MFGSSKKSSSRDKSLQGVIDPDGRRLNATATGKRVKLKRAEAEIKTLASDSDTGDDSTTEILPARVILNEFSDAGVGVYTTEALRMGQEVALTIDEPRRFYITGRIVFCNEVRTDSKLLQQITYPWRAGIEFNYKTDAERSEVAAYCEELRKSWLGALVPSIIPGPPKVQQPVVSTAAAAEVTADPSAVTEPEKQAA